MTEKLKYFGYTPIKNSKIDSRDPLNEGSIVPDRKKGYKIKVRSKMVYTFELFYFSNFVFVKFHPKIYESDPEKYKRCNIGLGPSEIRTLLNTCSKIVHIEMNKPDNEEVVFAFIGQWYEKDNILKRLSTVRFSIYLKQTALLFYSEEYNHNWFETLNLYCLSKLDEKKHSKKVSELLHYLASSPSLLMSFLTEEGKQRLLNEFPDSPI